MNINWRKVLGVAEKVIHVIKEELAPTEREETHGKHDSDNNSGNRNHHQKGEVKDDLH